MNTTKKIFVFYILVHFSFIAKSKSITDSLELSLKTATDTTKINLLNQLGQSYSETNGDKTISYSLTAIELSKQLNFPIGIAKAYNNIGIVYDTKGNYDSALYNYNLSLDVSTKINNEKQIANTLNNIGLVYWNKGDFDVALNYYLQSLKRFENIGSKKGEANTLSNIGLIYYDQHNYKQALEYQLKSLAIRESIHDDYGIGVSQTNIGLAYSELHDHTKALDYLKKSLETKKRTDDLYGVAIALGDIGVCYSELNQFDLALKYQLETLPIRVKLEDKFGLITSYCNISSNYISKHDYKTALSYSLKALPIAEQLKSKTKLKKVYSELYSEYKHLNNLQLALAYYEKYAALNDKIYSEKSASEIAEMQTKYETEKKDLEITKKNLELNKNQLELAKQKNELTLLIITILGIIVIFYILYTRYKFKQKALLNAEMLKQQELRSKAIIETEEKERTRIARELHDSVGQHLSAIKLNLSNLESTLDLKTEQEKTMLSNAISIIDDSVKEVRGVSHNMLPNVLLEGGLEKAVREFLSRMDSSGMLKIEFEVHQLEGRLESTVEIILFRVLQELMNNILKHSHATQVHVQLIQHDEELTLMVEDNGMGFNTNESQNKGIGLSNIESRITFLNGTIDIDSTPQKGTTVSIEIPMKK